MTKNKDVYNVSYSSSPKWGESTNTNTVGKTYASKTSVEEEDLFMQAVKQQHEAVLESEKQYLAKQKENQEKYAKGIKVFPDSVVSQIVQEHLDRAKAGFIKYNETLDRNDLSLVEWLQHTKEELMDAALYLEKTIQVLKNK
jgi:uncharacterized protein YaiL (DUF2058 family)